MYEDMVIRVNGKIDAEATRAARKKVLEEIGFGKVLWWDTGAIAARMSDSTYQDWTPEEAVEAFNKDFAAQDPREQPNLEGFNLKAPTYAIIDGEGGDLDLATVSPERRKELIRKYGSHDLVDEFFHIIQKPVIVKFDSQGKLHRIGKGDPDYPYKKLG